MTAAGRFPGPGAIVRASFWNRVRRMGLVSRLFSWWANEPLGTALFTRFRGQLVGTDALGNRYYQERNPRGEDARGRPTRRWVLYNGEVEASKVPAEWHGWLHGTHAEPPRADRKKYAWEQGHVPN